MKGPYDDQLEWPIQWKSHIFTLLINDKEVGKRTKKSKEKDGQRKDFFTRPTGYEGENFDHELVKNVTDNDKVVIKYDIKINK